MAATLKDAGEVWVTLAPDVTRFRDALQEVGEQAHRIAAEIRASLSTLPFAKAPTRERRAQRRADAVKRQERYDATPTFDKLAAISERRGSSARERERLLTRALA